GDAPERLFQVLEPERGSGPFPPLSLPLDLPGSLPLPLTRFFGREEEIARLLELLEDPSSGAPRLVTLTGPGGSGKTRLGLEVAARQWEPFGGAVWFVPLQDLLDARVIPYRI